MGKRKTAADLDYIHRIREADASVQQQELKVQEAAKTVAAERRELNERVKKLRNVTGQARELPLFEQPGGGLLGTEN